MGDSPVRASRRTGTRTHTAASSERDATYHLRCVKTLRRPAPRLGDGALTPGTSPCATAKMNRDARSITASPSTRQPASRPTTRCPRPKRRASAIGCAMTLGRAGSIAMSRRASSPAGAAPTTCPTTDVRAGPHTGPHAINQFAIHMRMLCFSIVQGYSPATSRLGGRPFTAITRAERDEVFARRVAAIAASRVAAEH